MRLLDGETIVQGDKGGGGSARTPVEQRDDLISVAKLKMLLAISEGEIQGDLTAQQIYLNDTQLANDDGTYNFAGVVWDWRKGTQDQPYIQGMPEVDNELSVGVTVTQSVPWTRQYTNLSLDAVRVKLSLPVQYQYKDNGDMVGTVTQYAIDLSTDGGTWVQVVDGRFNGKTTSEYQRDHRIDLPKATTGWALRVRRITPDSTSSKLINAFKVFSFAEIIDSKLRYPNTALLYIEVDASQFNGQAPKITCKPKGKLVRVPVTYDPVSRSYSGSWQGDFKYAYTNNPAWIFYDLVLDKIHGMGTRVDASMIDKWELYAIAQYCDQSVPDGAGGTEPRFTCNVFIQDQQDAYTVLKDIAAIFRGITFWGNSQIFVNADVPQVDANGNVDVDYTYHVANVVDGLFTYAGGSYKNRYSSCNVSYSDPANHYSDTVEGVYDSELVARYDVREMSLTAIGCTSQSEAHRRGRWALLSNAKDGTISFGVGLDGYIPVPAQIIGVADPFRSGKQNGGRIRAVSGRSVTLDRPVDYAAGDRLLVNLPDGTAQTRTIASVSSDKQTVTVSTNFRTTPDAGAVWAIDSDSLAIQYFRVTSISANGDGTFTVSGVQHDPNKYRYIDDGVRIEPAPITVTPISVLKPPANIQLSEVSFVEQGLSVASMQATWDRVEGAISYVAQWRKDKGDWINVSQTSAQGFSISGIYTGVYDVRVRGVNAAEVSSPWGYSESTTLTGKVGKPGTPVSLHASDNVVWAIDMTWAFPDGAGDTAYTEVQVATTADGQNPQFLAYVPYPGVSYQHGPMPAGVRRWYRARLVDKIGNTGDWTGFMPGMSNVNANDLIGSVFEEYLESDDGKALLTPLITDPAALAESILSNYDDVAQQWANFGENRAGIIEARKVAADAQSSVAQLETNVVASFSATNQKIDSQGQAISANQAAIQEKMTAYADASGGSAIYTLKAGVKYGGTNYDAGMSVAVTINGSQVVTRFAVNANQFVVASGSGNNIFSPFIIKDGQVLINQAFIGEGWITNAMIGGFIQSTNYVAGSTGWRLDKSGTFERNAANGSGRVVDTGVLRLVYDANGTLRIRDGLW
ncbi:host specificity protein J [Pantoea sp. Mb-10]|uniref:host specificity protein J n=1 Tax=unclassified Pantoea TaxID=2630326 RepID=UPI001E4829D9|nr:MULTISPECIES: host specificity protein J [unclassified Pantoea]MCE0491002.1 host specificity protein J [Pantoea sp. Mb-10]MCE0499840.1 host specificity protein J [Pantoea sp. Pb-8]